MEEEIPEDGERTPNIEDSRVFGGGISRPDLRPGTVIQLGDDVVFNGHVVGMHIVIIEEPQPEG